MQNDMTAEEIGREEPNGSDASAEIASLETQFDVVRFLRRTGESFSLKHFIAFLLPGFEAEKLGAHSIVSNWPAEVIAKYDALKMVRRSPGIRKLRATTIPFSLDLAGWIEGASQEDDLANLAEFLQGHGMQAAHVFPVHDALGNRGAIVWTGEKRTLSFEQRLLLQMISIQVFNRLAEIGAAWKTGQVVLTEREIECLSWTAAGKTSLEIAEILGLSEHTINHYLNQVTRKLEAVNRTQAVVKAIRRGFIT
ncbi:DNA-binding CsgD family transcriptional regulator [Mycoplana sp. BE70]|uniref:helix-turn-helix transcriptional regulator n=1 Tax=Mycoplana sp. BE70 TaxID=2817775 RepID=UPI00285BC2D2|nr:LuxR C-terminal-related transcriptional regulator [Mycoplana sp. BE70]MDR6756212.1 DNA-binding CsgD family transcriptional regulator [Mycoplana sp. BE70]